MRKSLTKIVATAATAALVATPVMAEKAKDLYDLNGMQAGNAERELRERGFRHTSNQNGQYGYVYSYWWDEGTDDCVRIEAYRNQVETVVDAPDQDCGHHTGNAGAAVAAVAGAAILGALLTHKSNHHEDNRHYDSREDEQAYERGYTDGLHNVAYHNYDRSTPYHNGYTAGVQQRSANTSYHSGHGGYRAAATYKDLQGARAAGGMSELERRGFRQVDNFTSGNTRYSIQYDRAGRQCVQVTIADGHFYDLRDIGRHPKCR